MKKLIFLMAAIAFIGFNSMAQVNQPDNSNNDKWDKDKTDDFVKKMANNSEVEVQLSQLAQQKATTQEIKDFAQIEAKEHSDALANLSAAYKNVPSALDNIDKNLINDFGKETGKDFDKKYIDEMVDRHQKEMDDLQEAFSKVTEPSLRGWISTNMLIVNKHLGEVKRIQGTLENKK